MKLIPSKEVAEIMGVPHHRINRWAREGIIPAYRYPGEWRFDEHEIMRFMQNCRTKAQPLKSKDIDQIMQGAYRAPTGFDNALEQRLGLV